MSDIIQLISPVMDKIPGHIAENSCCRKCGGLSVRRTACGPVDLASRVPPKDVPAFIAAVANRSKDAGAATRDPRNIKACHCEIPDQYPIVQRDTHKGRTLMICGSGPSLAEGVKMLKPSKKRRKQGLVIDEVWGCNDAAIWLPANGHRCDAAVGIDQSEALEKESWIPEPPDMPYILATSVDPSLLKHLHAHGRHDITLFHSFIGFQGEQHVYAMLYGQTLVAGEGLNVVNRAINVADWMGYDKIYVAGADNSFTVKKDGGLNFHVQGDPVEGIVLSGQVDGVTFHTKPDMLVSAIALVNSKKRMGSRLEFVGKTLPRALQHKDQEFMDRCIRWSSQAEQADADAQKRMLHYAPQLKSTGIKDLLNGGVLGADPRAARDKYYARKNAKENPIPDGKDAETRMLESDAFDMRGVDKPR